MIEPVDLKNNNQDPGILMKYLACIFLTHVSSSGNNMKCFKQGHRQIGKCIEESD